MHERRNRVVGAVAFFVAALVVIGGVALMATAGAARWRVVFERAAAPSPRALGLSALRAWRDVRQAPPEGVAALDGQVVEMTGLVRVEPGLGGVWLVGEALDLSDAAAPQLDRAVWVPLAGDDLARVAACQGSITRVAGTLRVGVAEVGGGRSAAWRLEPQAVRVREAASRGHGHDGH